MDKEKPVVPLLHDAGGPIYNPRVALGLFDRLAAGAVSEQRRMA